MAGREVMHGTVSCGPNPLRSQGHLQGNLQPGPDNYYFRQQFLSCSMFVIQHEHLDILREGQLKETTCIFDDLNSNIFSVIVCINNKLLYLLYCLLQ